MANTSILAAFERMWQHVVVALNNKSDKNHKHTTTDVDGLQSALSNKADTNLSNVNAETARTNLGAAPMYTSGTTDLTAGSSALATGTLHFVYE